MKLQVFNTENCRQVARANNKTTVSIDFKSGVLRLSKQSAEMMKLKAMDTVAIGFDEDENEWYLFKTDATGFILRLSNGKTSHSLILQNAAIVSRIQLFMNHDTGKNGYMLIGKEPVIDNDVSYWPIITASFKTYK